MDEHVPRAITTGLRLRGVDVITAQEDGRAATLDSDILDRATSLGRIVFTCDEDFLREAHRRQIVGQQFGGVAYIHQQAISVGRCIQDLELIAVLHDPPDGQNRVIYLPL